MVPEQRPGGGYNDLFNPNFAKTEISSKNGSLDFGDLKSGFEDSGGFGSKNNSIISGNDGSSPRSPVGRTDKIKKDQFNNKQIGKAYQNENASGLLKKNFNVEE